MSKAYPISGSGTRGCNARDAQEMQTDQLRHFIDVATLGSMTLAAEKNFMTPQGISKSISALENDLGCKLFKRTRNSVTLTKLGSDLLASAELVVSSEDRLREGVARLMSMPDVGGKRQLTAYCTSIAYETPIYFPLAETARGLFASTRFAEDTNEGIIDSVLASINSDPEDVTLGLVGLWESLSEENERLMARLSEKGFSYRPFLHTSTLAVVSSRSAFAHKRVLSRSDIISGRLAVSAHSDMEQAIAKMFGNAHISVLVTDATFRQRLAASGEFITFVPGISLSYGLQEGTTAVPMSVPSLIEMGFVGTEEVVDGPFVNNLVRRISDYYRSQQGNTVVQFYENGDPDVQLG